MTSATLACLSVVTACAQPRIQPPPAAPVAFSMDRPSGAIPGDLDLAIRIDLDAARRLLGPSVGRALQFDIVDATTEPKTAAMVDEALARSRTVWIAIRPGLGAGQTDNVLVLRGDFGTIEPRDAGFDPPFDLGAGYRVYERAAPKRRSSPSRVYARTDEWLVFVSEAEVDAAGRTIEQRAGDDHVDPPERGLISFSARAAPLVPLLVASYPTVAEVLDAAHGIEASAEADERGLRSTLEVRFDKEDTAKAAEERLVPLLAAVKEAKGIAGRLARGAVASTQGTVLVVTITLDPTRLAELIACFDHGAEC
jgi:hypothetical protein